MGHLFYTTSSFVYRFKAMNEFKLESVPKRSIWVKIGDFFVPCDLDICWVTLKDNRAPFLYHIKLCPSFQSHQWTQTWVTVRKSSIRVKIVSRVTLKFDGWPWKIIGHLFYTTPSVVHNFKAISEFKLKLQCRNSQFWSKSAIFCPVWPRNLTDDLGFWPLWPWPLTFYMDTTSIIGDNSWKFQDDTMTGTLWKRLTNGQTDGQKCS